MPSAVLEKGHWPLLPQEGAVPSSFLASSLPSLTGG